MLFYQNIQHKKQIRIIPKYKFQLWKYITKKIQCKRVPISNELINFKIKIILIKKNSRDFNTVICCFKNKIKSINKNFYFFFKILSYLKITSLNLIELNTLLYLKFNQPIFFNFINYKNKTLNFKLTSNYPTIKLNINNFILFKFILLLTSFINNLKYKFLIDKYNILLQKSLYLFFLHIIKNIN